MSKEEKAPLPLIRDFFGVLVIAFTVFALISLTSYNQNDPTFFRVYAGKAAVRNLGGVVGASLSDGLVRVFGSGAFLFPFVTLIGGWALIRRKEFQRWSIVPGVVFLACVCALLSIQLFADPYFGKIVQPGGALGSILHRFLVMWLNRAGAMLFLSTLFFISLLAMTGIPVNTLIDAGVKFGKILAGVAIKLTHILIDGLARFSRALFQRAAQAMANLKSWFKEWLQNRKKPAEIEKPRAPNAEPVIVTRTAAAAPAQKKPEPKPKKEKEADAVFPIQADLPFVDSGKYQIPPASLLEDPPVMEYSEEAKEQILKSTVVLEKKLADFGIDGKVVQVLPGPVITMYEFEPAPGIKVSRILTLTDDLALAMKVPSVRILAPVPGKAVVGIEIPNAKRETVYFKDIINSEEFASSKSRLVMAVGKDYIGQPVALDLAQVPHLLVAGATGSGKSVGINAMICSILLNATPEEVKMIMVDPKMLELSIFDGIPHLIAPVVTDSRKAAAALQWAVIEMERRYQLMAEKGVRNISGFNVWAEKMAKEFEAEMKRKEKEKKQKPAKPNSDGGMKEVEEEETIVPPPSKLPYIVIVIDELADLMMVASKGVEEALARLAQMARAAGIHLIVATQRPSVDVLTGLIKANFPARISYQVTSRVDSRTILDSMGAEKLLGKGDMLFLPPGSAKLQRIHGPMVSDDEIGKIIRFIKSQKKPDYKEEVFALAPDDENLDDESATEFDEKYDEAVEIVARSGQASISMIQRKLRVGYNRAARMVEVMEKEGVIGPSDGVRPREVFVKPISLEQE